MAYEVIEGGVTAPKGYTAGRRLRRHQELQEGKARRCSSVFRVPYLLRGLLYHQQVLRRPRYS